MSRLNRILFKKVALISALKVIRLLTICNEELQIVICPAKKRKALPSLEVLCFLGGPPGAVSNFLIEDYEAVLKIMSVENQKRKLRL